MSSHLKKVASLGCLKTMWYSSCVETWEVEVFKSEIRKENEGTSTISIDEAKFNESTSQASIAYSRIYRP